MAGGPSHIDMYDMKPEAPIDYRGEFRPVPTNVPGIDVCEHLPMHTKVADRFTLIRRLTFDLTGLPPTPQEIESFVNDKDAKAYEKDKLDRWNRQQE